MCTQSQGSGLRSSDNGVAGTRIGSHARTLTHTYTLTHTHTHIHTHTHARTYVHTISGLWPAVLRQRSCRHKDRLTHTYTLTHTHTHTRTHAHTCTRSQGSGLRSSDSGVAGTRIGSHAHTHSHTHTYTYTHTHARTYVHTISGLWPAVLRQRSCRHKDRLCARQAVSVLRLSCPIPFSRDQCCTSKARQQITSPAC